MKQYLGSLLRQAKTVRGIIALAMIGFLLFVSLDLGQVKAQTSDKVTISQNAAAQIQALEQEKRSRTPAQQKISSGILYTIKAKRGDQIAKRVPNLNSFTKTTADGKVRIDIETNVKITTELLAKIQALGAEVLSSLPDYNAIQVLVALNSVESLAALPEVRFVRPYIEPMHSRAIPATVGASKKHLPQAGSVSSVEQESKLSPSVQHLALTPGIPTPVPLPPGSVTKLISEGDIAHAAVFARITYGVDGTGVKIGVLSDSYDNQGGAAADIAIGKLPATGVTLVGSGEPAFGGTDEGRAMLQIIHDLAPGSDLYFATAFNSEADFASNILALQAAGCDIIVDDAQYFHESVFQDGIVAQAVNTVTAKGVLYFSSAGNEGNQDHGTAGVWEGDFVDGGPAPLGLSGRVHNFGSSLTATANSLTSSSGPVTLQWSDPFGQSANDYDLYVLNPSGTAVIATSNNFQTGKADPYEIVGSQAANNQVIVVQYSGVPRFLHLNTNRGRLAINTRGQTSGHSAAVDAFSVAAVSAEGRTTPFTGGAANPVETFSSDGPRRIFYNADGTPVTPENFLSSGGVVRQKPDIAAADGVMTNVPGFNPFFGTSAAAPHAAAVAALLKSFRPNYLSAIMRLILEATALDIETPKVDPDSGYGIVMADRALEYAALLTNKVSP